MTIEFDVDMVNTKKFTDIAYICIGEVPTIPTDGNQHLGIILFDSNKQPIHTIGNITPRILATLKIKE